MNLPTPEYRIEFETRDLSIFFDRGGLKVINRILRCRLSDISKMRMIRGVKVFESISDHAVKAAMSESQESSQRLVKYYV